MNETSRELVTRWWGEAWESGLWAASWRKSIADLTPAQAAWSPPAASGSSAHRHSIWQIVLHIIFWRESWLRRVQTGRKPTDDDITSGNFPFPGDTTEEAWNAVVEAFRRSQARIGAAFADASVDVSGLVYVLPHDCYHFGQVNYLRAMQGLPPIE